MRIIGFICYVQAFILMKIARLLIGMAFSPLLTLFTLVMACIGIYYWIL